MGSIRVALLSAGMLCLATPAYAQDDYLLKLEEAKALYQKAEAHYARGEFKQALELYERAHQKAPEPMFLLGIGQAYKALDRCEKALNYFERYLVSWSDAPNRQMVERLIKSCQDRLERKRQQEQAAREQAEREQAREKDRPKEEPSPQRGLRPVWFWTSVALAGALLATGGVTGGLALSKNQEYKDEDTTVSRRLDLRDQGKTLQTVSTATFIAGGVAAGAAAILYFYTGWDKGKGETRVSAGAVPSGATVTFQGTF